MKILGLFDSYWPHHRSGAERMSHNILREMAVMGHECQVITRMDHLPYEYEGVKVHNKTIEKEVELVRWADVVVSAFNYSRRAMNMCKDWGRTLFIIIHNELNPDIMINEFINIRVIYNSNFCKDKCKFRVPSIVFPPPVMGKDWIGESNGKHVTMLNVNEIKGGDKFVELAGMLPKTKFLGTLGSYGVQQISESRNNITVLPNSDRVSDLYEKTKVLLMLSRYESYGQTQIEAGFYGIPTIYNPTPGLLESWGEWGIAIDRNNLEEWAKEIKRLFTDQEYYAERSAQALQGALAQEEAQDWAGLTEFLMAK